MLKKNFVKKNLSSKIHQYLGFSKNISSLIVDDFFENLISMLSKEKKIKISNFGTFKVVNKKERVGRNPKTKAVAKIEARKVVKFKPSLLFKKKLNSK